MGLCSPGFEGWLPRFVRPLVGLLVLSALLSCAVSPQDTDQAADWRPLYEAWQHPDPLPDFLLVDARGGAFQLSQLTDGYLLVGFIFTRCQVGEACPLTTLKMKQTLELSEAPDIPDLHLLSLTLDPEYDTPERLLAYATAHGAALERWTFATGPEDLMTDGLPSLFNVLAMPSPEVGISHTVKVALLRPDLTLVADWKDDAFSPEAVVAAAKRDALGGLGPAGEK